MLKYTIEDRVEMGHYEHVGGTTYIGITTTNIHDGRADLLKIIDYLDHCTVGVNPQIPDFSQRYFLLDKSTNVLADTLTVVSWLLYENPIFDELQNPIITVRIGNGSLSHEPFMFNQVIGTGFEELQ